MKIEFSLEQLKTLSLTPNEFVFLQANRFSNPYTKVLYPNIDIQKLIEYGFLMESKQGLLTTDLFMSKIIGDMKEKERWFTEFWEAYPKQTTDADERILRVSK